MMTKAITRIVNSRHDLALNALAYTGRSLLVLCAAYSTLGIIISGFDFPVDMQSLFLIMLIASFSVTAIATIFRLRGILLSLIPALLLLIYANQSIAEAFKWFLFTITTRYNVWLPIPVLFTGNQQALSPLLPFVVLGIFIVFILSITICLSRSAALTVLATLPFALLSFVLTETMPDAVYLSGLIASYLTLIISNALYPHDYRKSALLILPSLIIAVIITGSVYLITPPDKYVRSTRAEAIRGYVNSIAEQATSMFSSSNPVFEFNNGWFSGSGSDAWAFNTSQVDIADAGARVITDRHLLSISVSDLGTYYIRGFSLSDFDGKSWRESINPELVPAQAVRTPRYLPFQRADSYAYSMPAQVLADYFMHMPEDGESSDVSMPRIAGMTISKINDNTDVSYRPYYYRTHSNHFDDGYNPFFVEDIYSAQGFSIYFFHISGSIRDYILNGESLPFSYADDYDAPLSLIYTDVYTQINGSTAAGLRQLALDAGIDPEAEREVVADMVAAYIRSSASYTLNPPEIPDGEDFALYFLQTSKAGYCIHFATAATLMLRSLDIPARFVSGYVATVPRASTDEFVLTDRNAHAWVEVLYDDIGWLPLEVTPSTGASQVPVPQPHTPVQQSQETHLPEQEDDSQQRPPRDVNETTTAQIQGTGSGPGTQRAPSRWLLIFLSFFTLLILLIISANVRVFVLKRNREKRFMQKDTNAAVLSMWKYMSKLSRMHVIIPDDIEQLALKARFSKHRITQQERDRMLAYARSLAAGIYEGRSDFGRFWFRYVRGLG